MGSKHGLLTVDSVLGRIMLQRDSEQGSLFYYQVQLISFRLLLSVTWIAASGLQSSSTVQALKWDRIYYRKPLAQSLKPRDLPVIFW